MSRTLSEIAVLFLAPFALYFLYSNLRRAYILSFDHWTRVAITRLTLAGLTFVLFGLLLNGIFADRHEGAYVPAHMEGGHLVTGHIQ
jgi:hypothetical protein